MEELKKQLADKLDQASKEAELNEINNHIGNNYLWVLTGIGLPGNVLTIVTLVLMAKKSPATFFMVLLAFCDGSALVAKLIGRVIAKSKVELDDAACKLEFFPPFLGTMANWTLVMIALERFFSVCYPLKKNYLFTTRRSYILASVIFVVLLVIFVLPFGVMYESNDKTYKCAVREKYAEFFTTEWYWINFCLYLFLPFLCIVILTGLVIRGLYVSRMDRRSILGGKNEADGSKKNDNNSKLISETERAERMITIMLILAAILFLILTLPGAVYFLMYEKSSDGVVEARWQMFYQISTILIDSNHAINFFLYFISAKRFRNHFISVVTCKRYPKKRRSPTSSSASNSTQMSKISSTQM